MSRPPPPGKLLPPPPKRPDTCWCCGGPSKGGTECDICLNGGEEGLPKTCAEFTIEGRTYKVILWEKP